MKISIRVVQISHEALATMDPSQAANAILKREVAENLRAVPSAAVPLTSDVYNILQAKVDQPPTWAVSKKTPEVYVPMFPYDIGNSAEVLVQFGAQLGAVASSHTRGFPSPRNLFVIISQVLSRPDGQPGYRVYAGIAAC